MSRYDLIRASLDRVRSRRGRQMAGLLVFASLAAVKTQQTFDDRDASRRISQTVRERSTDDSIADSDRVESKVSQFDREDTEAHGWESSGVLTKAERARLEREMRPYKQFRADVARVPLRLMA